LKGELELKEWEGLTMEEFIRMLIKQNRAKHYLKPAPAKAPPHEVVGGKYLREMKMLVEIRTADVR